VAADLDDGDGEVAALDGSVRLIAAEASEDLAGGRHVGPDAESDHLG
jgi:hypothetical protein